MTPTDAFIAGLVVGSIGASLGVLAHAVLRLLQNQDKADRPMDCTGPGKGGSVERKCEAITCMTPNAPVILDPVLKKYLCNRCWSKMPIPKPPKRP